MPFFCLPAAFKGFKGFSFIVCVDELQWACHKFIDLVLLELSHPVTFPIMFPNSNLVVITKNENK